MDAPNVEGVPETCCVSQPNDLTSRQHFSTDDPPTRTEGGLGVEAVSTPFLPCRRETNVVDVCRACLSRTDLTKMCELELEGISCVQLYETLTSIRVKFTDEISQSLCQSCFATVGRFYVFRNGCIRSEKILNDMLAVFKNKQPSEEHKLTSCSPQPDCREDYERDEVESPQGTSKDQCSVAREPPQVDCDEPDKTIRHMVVPDINDCNNDFSGTNNLSVVSCYYSDGGTEDRDPLQNSPDDSSNPKFLDKIISFLIEDVNGDDVKKALLRGRPCKSRQRPKPQREPKYLEKVITFVVEEADGDDVKKATSRGGPSEAGEGSKTKGERDEDVKVYSCMCGLNFTKRADLYDHRRKERHFERPCHTCSLCKKKFKRLHLLQDHMNVHAKKKPNVCGTCGRAFAYGESLRQHVRFAHEERDSFMCDICGREFTTKFSLRNHIMIHKGQKPYLCHQCGAQFTFDASFKLHMKKHADEKTEPKEAKPKPLPATKRVHVCECCGKTFFGQTYYNHKKSHRDVSPYACKLCGKRFTQWGTLRSHMYIHTGERPYKCEVCQKGFTTSGSLKSHVYIHTGEKPYKCGQCDRGFTHNQHLKLHTWVHNDEKPFQCTMCDRGFRQKMYLTAHMNGHLGIRPYKCEVCDKDFCDQTTMKKHRKRMHPEFVC